MKVLVIKCLDDNFSYIVLNEANNNACVIDPSESDPIIQIIKKKNQSKVYTQYTSSSRSCGRQPRIKKRI